MTNDNVAHGELTLGELFRGIKEIKETLRVMSTGLLTQDLFAAEKRLLNEGIESSKDDIATLRADVSAHRERVESSERAEHLRAKDTILKEREQQQKNKQFIWALLATPMISGVVSVFVSLVVTKGI